MREILSHGWTQMPTDKTSGVNPRFIRAHPWLLIRHQYSSNVMPAKAGIQWRAKRADVCYCWIPGQARNDETDTVYVPDQ
jgi:hypothetical protein